MKDVRLFRALKSTRNVLPPHIASLHVSGQRARASSSRHVSMALQTRSSRLQTSSS